MANRGEVFEVLGETLARTVETVEACGECGFFASKGSGCPVCSDGARDVATMCVVEQASDILPIERSGEYRGNYHVLGGRLSPLDDVGPEQLRIAGLVERVRTLAASEVILAFGGDVENEATANYLEEVLQTTGAVVTRLAQGLPAGGNLEHADGLTLARALAGRRSSGLG